MSAKTGDGGGATTAETGGAGAATSAETVGAGLVAPGSAVGVASAGDVSRLAVPWIRSRARTHPGRTALVAPDRHLTYAALLARAEARAAGLSALGIGRGDVVAALLESAPDLAELLHAVDLCGATLLPLNFRLAPPEIAFQLRDGHARVLVHGRDGQHATAVAAADAACVRLVPLPDAAGRASPPGAVANSLPDPVAIDPREPLVLIYTSGTSGRPKGALLSRANFRASAAASALHLGVEPGDRWLACMPLFHVGGLSILLRSVLYGTEAWVHPRFDPVAVSRALDRDGITLLSLTATMLHRLLDARGSRRAPPTLRCVLLGGSATPRPLLERGRRLGFPLAPTYGLTEATSQVATGLPGDAEGLTPLPGTRVRVVDEAGRPVEPGTEGEIQVRSATVLERYVHEPARGKSEPGARWLPTGDMGRLDARGRLFVLDRRSDLIVSGGENVYPAEVERVLAEHPDVAEVGVAGVEDPEFGRRPAAWIVLRRSATAPSAATLGAFCRARLAGYKVPVRFHIVAALPRNAAGKLLRTHLV